MYNKFKGGDIVVCTRTMDRYGYIKGETYKVIDAEGMPKIVHPDKDHLSWVFANHELVIPNFELMYKKKRPKYADWQHA